MSIILQGLTFLKRYFFKHPIYMITYLITYRLRGFSFPMDFYKKDEIKNLLQEGKSLIRLGDGDMVNIPLDIPHHTGYLDKNVKFWHKTLVEEYSPSSPYLLAIPRFITNTNEELRLMGHRKLNAWLPVKIMYFLTFKKSVRYMDAHNFYYDDYFNTLASEVFMGKKIILVANAKAINIQRHNNNLPWKEIFFVEVPSFDAVGSRNQITRDIDQLLEGVNKKEVVIFISCGVLAKRLAYLYSHKGYQAIDIGKVAEVMFTGTSIQYLV